MKIIRNSNLEFIPASHENPLNPGCLKKVLFKRDDLDAGRVQMINWSILIKNKSFEKHYHEDMEEVFVILSNEATIIIENEKEILKKGDAVFIPPKLVHQMLNETNLDTEYISIGIALGDHGKTVNV